MIEFIKKRLIKKNLSTLALHARNNINTGDRWCCPLDYFSFPCNQIVDIRDSLGQLSPSLTIFGGGAITRNTKRVLRKNKKIRRSIKVAWGIGHTRRGYDGFYDGHDSTEFHLYGNRDYKSNHGEYVPCASCMHPAFDKEYKVKQDIVFFGHNKLHPFPHGQSNKILRIEDVLEYLGSADTIVTSSYHGVYWGLLLGRKVIAVPTGSKFYGFKYPTPITTEWQTAKGQAHPEALEESRYRNERFYKKVIELIE